MFVKVTGVVARKIADPDPIAGRGYLFEVDVPSQVARDDMGGGEHRIGARTIQASPTRSLVELGLGDIPAGTSIVLLIPLPGEQRRRGTILFRHRDRRAG